MNDCDTFKAVLYDLDLFNILCRYNNREDGSYYLRIINKQVFLKNMGQSGLFSVYFRYTIFTRQCEKCPNVHPVYGAGI